MVKKVLGRSFDLELKNIVKTLAFSLIRYEECPKRENCMAESKAVMKMLAASFRLLKNCWNQKMK